MPMNTLLTLALPHEDEETTSAFSQLQAKNVSFSRIQWACRRGMLELDLLLARFLEKQYANLSEAECLQLMHLLNEEDTSLYAWLMGQESPPTPFQLLLDRIRRA